MLLHFLQEKKGKIVCHAVHRVKWIKYCAEYTVLVREIGRVKHLSISCPLLYTFFLPPRVT